MNLRRGRPEPDIPTASMADIAFMLIVFFMVTTVFAVSQGLSFTQSRDEEGGPAPQHAIHILIMADNSLLVDGVPMGVATLLSALRPKLERDPLKPVVLEPVPEASYAALVDVLDELRQAKKQIGVEVAHIALPTQRELAELDELWVLAAP